MKKIISVLLIAVMVLGLCSCGTKDISELKTLNEILKNGYEALGTMIMDNVYVQTVVNSKDDEYLAVVKVLPDQYDAFQAIDFLADDAQKQYMDLIGDNELTDLVKTADVMPDKDLLEMYTGMTIAEFEMGGAEMTGYVGADGQYTFDFSDDICDYCVELEDGTVLEDYDDMDLYNEAIQEIKIKSVECIGLSSAYLQNFVEQFLDPEEKAVPKEMGEPKSSLEEVNTAVGCNIEAVDGAQEEKFSVIDDSIAQYIYKLDDMYYCVRATSDFSIDIADDEFPEDGIVDEDGYYTISYSQNDSTNSVRFVFNNYQYAYIVYDNGELDYQSFNDLQKAYVDAVCEYPEDSAFKDLSGTYTSEDGYSMSIIPVSNDSAQVTAVCYGETYANVWTMIIKSNGSVFTYDEAKAEVYENGESTSNMEGGGSITANDGALTWNGHVFTK